jgi:hypothetical protein
MGKYPKLIGKVKISGPVEVQNKCTELGINYFNGMIFCTVPEMGFLDSDFLPCRYGLALPYLRVQVGWEVLVEPTIIENSGLRKRWFYTGIADCGGNESQITPDDKMQMLIQLVSQVIYADGTTLHLSSQAADEPFVLGNTLKTELDKIVDALTQLNTDFTNWVVAPNDGGTALKTAVMAGFVTKAQAVLDDILSEKIFGE